MKSPKRDKDESILGRDIDIGTRRTVDRDSIREQLERGELVIEFEREEPDETMH